MSFKENAEEIRDRAGRAMVHRDRSMIGPSYIYDENILNGNGSSYSAEVRNYQGIPSIEVTKKGRLFTVFYTGKDDEGPGNYLLLQKSDDGKSFGKPFMAVVPTTEGVRCFDPDLWCSPDGRLHLYWNQSYGYFDGRSGVWCATCDDPDADEPRFGAPKRIANGVMMCKPIEKSNGEWLLPAAVWPMRPFYDEPDCDGGTAWQELENRYIDGIGFYQMPEETHPNVYISRDKGESWELYGHTDDFNRMFPEHMVFEKKDGTLGMYVRTGIRGSKLGYAESKDGGATWSNGVLSDIYNPCTRFCIRRLPSGRLLLINHLLGEKPQRNNLTAFISEDDGESWCSHIVLDERCEVSYPDFAISPDGYIYAIYDYNRYIDKEILVAKFTEADVLAGKLISEGSELRIPVCKALGINPREIADKDKTN